MRRIFAIPLAIYLGLWAHEGTHSVQGYVIDGELDAPFVFPFTVFADCWMGSLYFQADTAIPGIGCTEGFTEDTNLYWASEAMAYVVGIGLTFVYAFILKSMRRVRDVRETGTLSA